MKGIVAALAILFILSGIAVFRLAAEHRDSTPANAERLASGDRKAPEEPRRAALRLTPEQQRRSGIATKTLEAVRYQPELRAYGKVLDLSPLLELRARYRTAAAELSIAQAALDVAQKTYQRVRSLHREAIIATRELNQAASQQAADRARVAAGRLRVQAIREEALQIWGSELFERALDSDSKIFAELLTRQQLLLLITLAAEQALPADTRFALVGRGNDRQNAQEAYLISPAPKTDELAQGETWFFYTASGRLRTGMRVDAWIPHAGPATAGVVIPRAAILWHNGKPSVYLQSGSTFTRRAVAQHQAYAGGWFIADGFQAGDRIVVSGGQMLLSEEFHRQIPDEDAD